MMPDIHDRLNAVRTEEQMEAFVLSLAPHEVGLVSAWLAKDSVPVQPGDVGHGPTRSLVPLFILTCLLDRIRATTAKSVKEIYERRGPLDESIRAALPVWTSPISVLRKLVTGGAVAKMLLHADDPLKLLDIVTLICPPEQRRNQIGSAFHKVCLIVRVAYKQSRAVQEKLNAKYANEYDLYLQRPNEL